MGRKLSKEYLENLPPNSVEYQQIITSLQEQVVTLRKTNSLLLSELKTCKKSTSAINNRLLSYQQSNLNMLEELQSSQYTNTMLREHLDEEEERNAMLTKQNQNNKLVYDMLRDEILQSQRIFNWRKKSKTLENVKEIIDSLENSEEFESREKTFFCRQKFNVDYLITEDLDLDRKDSGYEDIGIWDQISEGCTSDEESEGQVDDDPAATGRDNISEKYNLNLKRRRKATVIRNEEDDNLMVILPPTGQPGRHNPGNTTGVSNDTNETEYFI